MNVLQITPHLGGGVGKAVAALVGVASDEQGAEALCHRVICLEAPERDQFSTQISAAGWPVSVARSWPELRDAIACADLVVVHFWAHPLCAELLARADWPAARVMLWSHMSGLGTTRFPAGVTSLADRFLVTAPASFGALGAEMEAQRVGLMSSGLVEGLPAVPARPVFSDQPGCEPCVGYVGTLNPAKIHPDYVAMAAAIPLPGLRVTMVGDAQPAAALQAQASALGRDALIDCVGYHTDVLPWLERFHLFLYLLNPQHYGTAENALLEAMAMGVVPIVMANRAELDIVEHGKTGVVVRSADELAAAVMELCQAPERWAALSSAAAEWARAVTSPHRLRATFAQECSALMTAPKTDRPDPLPVFGSDPAAWFLAFQSDRAPFGADGAILRQEGAPNPAALEPAKGSVFHFQRAFPANACLQRWAKGLTEWQEAQR